MIDTDKHKKVEYQLRRIGLAATKAQVRDVMKLESEVSRFGRHSGNDYYLDSAKLDCFISRWHSEIHRVLQNGKIHFVLRDNSLNGTYVNHHRVLGNHLLKPGEIICFGHTNGKNLKPGNYAPQTDSEFEFVFEECPEDVEDLQHEIDRQHSRVNHPVVDSTTDIHSPSSPSIPPLQSIIATLPHSQETPHAVSTADTVSRRLVQAVTPTPRTSAADKTSPTVPQDISSKNSSSSNTSGLVSLDQLAAQQSGGDHRTSAPCNITVQVTPDRVFPVKNNPQQAVAPVQKVITPPTEDIAETVTSTASSPADISRDSSPSSEAKTSRPSGPKDSSNSSNTSGRKRKAKPAGPSKKKVRRRSSVQQSDSEEDEEDDTWHYEGDKCDAYDCKRPKSKKVSWVQCDDCDDWYHTACAGCRYDSVKKNHAEFHCGCAPN